MLLTTRSGDATGPSLYSKKSFSRAPRMTIRRFDSPSASNAAFLEGQRRQQQQFLPYVLLTLFLLLDAASSSGTTRRGMTLALGPGASLAFHLDRLPTHRRIRRLVRSSLRVQRRQPPLQQQQLEAKAEAELSSSTTRVAVSVAPPPRSVSSSWFPTRIQDALVDEGGERGGNCSDMSSGDDDQSSISSYRSLVHRMYLRHVAVETREMADVALSLYQRLLLHPEEEEKEKGYPREEREEEQMATSSAAAAALVTDPFGRVAELLSVDSTTAATGGTVGWVDLLEGSDRTTNGTRSSPPSREEGASLLSSSSAPVSFAYSPEFVRRMEAYRPKAGDVVIIQDETSGRWHVVLVAELWLRPRWLSLDSNGERTVVSGPDRDRIISNIRNEGSATMLGAFRGQNRVLSRFNQRFRGRGVRPESPDALRTYRIQTAGCQMNVADSERLEGILAHDLKLRPLDDANIKLSVPGVNDGFVWGGSRDGLESLSWPDVVVLNTCSIRDKAEQKVYNALGPYCAAKRQGNRMVVVVTGCVAQQEGQDLLARVPEVDAVVGPQYIPFLRNVIDLVSSGQQVVATSPLIIAEQDMNVPPVRGHDVRAWVNVIYGCNEHCTYCVVPATRGTEQSRTMEAILAECLSLASSGYKEITLIGQNIDAYGRDMVPKRTFADLLTFLNARLPSPMRIRYVTSHPRYFGQRVIDAVASLDKVCECFHMPFQAGDDEVLKRMRRGYTYDSYLRIISRIRKRAPDASITTDIIVGFPGETEEAFEKTLQLMEAVKFDNVNSFAYSPRPNTEAALWTDQMISDEVKADRLQRVQKLAAKHGMERSLRYVDRTEEVLVEGANPRNSSQVMGRTRQGRQVYFDGDLSRLRGKLVNVLITEARTWSLIGELIV